MTRRPDTPCTECGTLLWSGTTSLPASRRTCQACRRRRPGYQERRPPWKPRPAPCERCSAPFLKQTRRNRLCPACAGRRRSSLQPRPPELNGRPRQRAIAHVRATQPSCHLCGYPVDLTLNRQRHPLGSTVDELVPRSRGGSALDPANLGHAHRICNTSRGVKDITPEVQARCRSLVDELLGHASPITRRW